MYEELVRTIIGYIVNEPEAVEIKLIEGEAVVIVELRVDPSDLGKVIGREGSMAQAIRTILTNAASRQNKRAILQIVE
jgi:uncharacterized protein